MADLKTTQLTALAATPASNDLLMIVDVSDTTMAASGTNKKIATSYFVNTDGNDAKVTGGGTIALAGYTLTVPVAGTAVMPNFAQTFVKAQTFTPDATNVTAINVDMPALTSQRSYRWALGGTLRGYLQNTATENEMIFSGFDNGSGKGSNIQLGRNTNGTASAAGFVAMTDKGGQVYRVWPDDNGLLRINNADPTSANDTAGSVVGAQSSSLDSKNVVGGAVSVGDIYLHIESGAAAVRRFTYKSGAFNNEEFSGMVVDYAPRYGMDRDGAHPAGKSLNVVTAIGDLMIAVTDLAARVAALEA